MPQKQLPLGSEGMSGFVARGAQRELRLLESGRKRRRRIQIGLSIFYISGFPGFLMPLRTTINVTLPFHKGT